MDATLNRLQSVFGGGINVSRQVWDKLVFIQVLIRIWIVFLVVKWFFLGYGGFSTIHFVLMPVGRRRRPSSSFMSCMWFSTWVCIICLS